MTIKQDEPREQQGLDATRSALSLVWVPGNILRLIWKIRPCHSAPHKRPIIPSIRRINNRTVDVALGDTSGDYFLSGPAQRSQGHSSQVP